MGHPYWPLFDVVIRTPRLEVRYPDDSLLIELATVAAQGVRRISNIEASQVASLLVDDYVEDWSLLWWIRVDGTARVLESGSEYDQAIELLVDKYEQYRRQRPPGPVIAIDITSWRAWPSPESWPSSS
jgi:PPOX class probable F420-dependent enzyme